MRDETEWVETVDAGWNTLTGADCEQIVHKVRHFSPPSTRAALYGDGRCAARCVTLLQ